MSIAASILYLPLVPPPPFSSSALLRRHRAPPLPAVSIRIKTSVTNISPSDYRYPFPPPFAAAAAATAAAAAMETKEIASSPTPLMQLLFVEMGVGYDQHGQDITAAAMRACKDAIRSNSIPAFRRGSIPGVNSDQMKLKIQLGVPRSTQHLLDIERVKSVFPYGEIISFEVADGGMICSSGTCLEEMGDKNEDCYIVNAAVYVGY